MKWLINCYSLNICDATALSPPLSLPHLPAGADINSQATDGATALYEATKNGHEQIVKLLISQNADANKPEKRGLLPLHIAAQRGSDM